MHVIPNLSAENVWKIERYFPICINPTRNLIQLNSIFFVYSSIFSQCKVRQSQQWSTGITSKKTVSLYHADDFCCWCYCCCCCCCEIPNILFLYITLIIFVVGVIVVDVVLCSYCRFCCRCFCFRCEIPKTWFLYSIFTFIDYFSVELSALNAELDKVSRVKPPSPSTPPTTRNTTMIGMEMQVSRISITPQKEKLPKI